MPTRRVDATRDSDTSGKSRNAKQSELRKKPAFQKTPELRAVGGPTHPENTGTPNSRNTDSSGKHRSLNPSGKCRNTEEPELPTRAETSEVRLKRKTSENLDIRKESWRPIRNQNRIGCLVNEPEMENRNQKKVRQTQIRRGAKRNRTRRAEEPEEPQVELEGEC
jgi:hypothetical protein